MLMEHRFAAALARARALISAGFQILRLLLAALEQARPVGIDQEMDYEGKIQLVIMATK